MEEITGRGLEQMLEIFKLRFILDDLNLTPASIFYARLGVLCLFLIAMITIVRKLLDIFGALIGSLSRPYGLILFFLTLLIIPLPERSLGPEIIPAVSAVLLLLLTIVIGALIWMLGKYGLHDVSRTIKDLKNKG